MAGSGKNWANEFDSLEGKRDYLTTLTSREMASSISKGMEMLGLKNSDETAYSTINTQSIMEVHIALFLSSDCHLEYGVVFLR